MTTQRPIITWTISRVSKGRLGPRTLWRIDLNAGTQPAGTHYIHARNEAFAREQARQLFDRIQKIERMIV